MRTTTGLISTARTSILTIAAALALGGAGASHASGTSAELRSSAALLPAPAAGLAVPTAPAGGIVAGAQPWFCDAAQGFAPVVAAEAGVADPILAVATTGNVRLPIAPNTTPATCGQIAYDASNGFAYVTQGVVDKATPSASRGILRVPLDPATGALAGTPVYIATTAGLDGNQPTGAALGPDGNLYVVFLKSGNIKRIVNPGSGTTQAVQSVGNTPNGHFGRALAFVGPDLYIGSVDALSVIHDAVNPACTGGCNATPINDGFAGIAHPGVASDGVDAVYFSVAGNPLLPGSNQVWRYSASSGQFTFVAQGGADRNGGHASGFSFVPGKTDLLALDAAGNLWIGDDTSNATVPGGGRLWTVSAGALAGLTSALPIAGTNIQAIFDALHGAWSVTLRKLRPDSAMLFVPTFDNTNMTFTATITAVATGSAVTDSGTWTLSPPEQQAGFGDPSARLTLTDAQGVVLFSNDILLQNVNTFISFTLGTGSLGAQSGAIWTRSAP